jgi:hypothetical protein
MAQGALITGLTPEVTALRGLLNEAIASEPAFVGVLAGKFSGLDTVYRPADTDAHPLTGGRAHDHEGEGGSRCCTKAARYSWSWVTDRWTPSRPSGPRRRALGPTCRDRPDRPVGS